MIDGDIQQKIIYDVAGEVAAGDSKLTYTTEMLKFRKKIEREWFAWKKKHPDAELYVPPELPDAEPDEDD